MYPDQTGLNVVYPFITYNADVSDLEYTTLDGATGYHRTRVQLGVWSRNYEEAFTAREDVRAALVGWSDEDSDGIKISSVVPAGRTRLWDPVAKAWQLIQDLFIEWEAA